MEAHNGDRLVVKGRRIGQGRRSGEVTRVEGNPSHPRLWVRWDDGHKTLLMPGPGVTVQPKRS